MNKPTGTLLAFLGIVTLAGILRLGALEIRPMHCDEAVHAVKFGDLLERGDYRYDPYEYHGPTLNFFSLIPAKLCGSERIEDVTETQLRIVPAVFSMLLVVLPFFARKTLGTFTALWISFLFAVSPAMVFYSRYYIQEMLLVSSTGLMIFAGFRMLSTGKVRWAFLAGFAAGLMHASKETCVITFACMAFSLLTILFITKKTYKRYLTDRMELNFGVLVLTTVAVSFLFFSSFLKYPDGFLDSFRTYSTYFTRASESVHLHPWYYYFRIFGWFQIPGGPRFSEGVIFVLALLVPLLGFRIKKEWNPVVLFQIIFVASMLMVYSLIPYKTPWSFLTVFSGLIVLAGVGIGYLFEYLQRFDRPVFRMIWMVAMSLAALQLLIQCLVVNFVLHSSTQNPYVYSHPTTDVFTLSDTIHEIKMHPEGIGVPVQVIAGDSDYWPLPWYFRDLDHVGWFSEVETGFTPAPLIVTTPDLHGEIISAAYAAFEPGQSSLYRLLGEKDFMFRPGKPMSILVTDELYRKVYEAPVDIELLPAIEETAP